MSKQGVIVTWNDEKGFGFIAPADGGKQLFVHVSALRKIDRAAAVGAQVVYSEARDNRGRISANNVKPLASAHELGPAAKAFFTSSIFLLIVASLVAIGKLPGSLLWIYMGLSIFTFGAYFRDKNAARRGWRRIPEETLHLLSLLGGWPGALFAQQALRHKSVKTSFRTGFWITVILNIAMLGYLLTDQGRGFSSLFLG